MGTKRLVTAKALSYDGKTVCTTLSDPKDTLFIPGLIPGEEAILHVEDDIVNIDEITKISKDRREAPCKYFQTCGGCDLQFMSIATQREHKFQMIKHTISNHFKIDCKEFINISTNLPEFNYRKKTNLHRKNKKIGFFSKKTNSLVAIDRCLLLDESINKNIEENDYYQDLDNQIEEVVLELHKSKVRKAFLGKNKRKIFSNEETTSSFCQINEEGNKKLVEIVSNLKWGEVVTEFYAGSGNFTFCLDSSTNIIAIESDQNLVKAANKKIERENRKNIEFVCSTTESYIKNNELTGDILLDPPRPGAKALCSKLEPKRNSQVVYVSCNITSLGRDLKILVNKGYSLEKLYFVDMFPQTKHVECLAILK